MFPYRNEWLRVRLTMECIRLFRVWNGSGVYICLYETGAGCLLQQRPVCSLWNVHDAYGGWPSAVSPDPIGSVFWFTPRFFSFQDRLTGHGGGSSPFSAPSHHHHHHRTNTVSGGNTAMAPHHSTDFQPPYFPPPFPPPHHQAASPTTAQSHHQLDYLNSVAVSTAGPAVRSPSATTAQTDFSLAGDRPVFADPQLSPPNCSSRGRRSSLQSTDRSGGLAENDSRRPPEGQRLPACGE